MGDPIGIYTKYSEKGMLMERGMLDGFFKCVFDQIELKDIWYYKNKRISLSNLPAYIPTLPNNKFNYNTKYYARTGKWIEYNEIGEITIKNWKDPNEIK